MKLVFFSCIIFISAAVCQPKIPKLDNWMTDLTNTLKSSQLQDLNGRLKIYEDSTSNQLVGLMINTLDNYPLEYYSEETATQNKIGTKKNDNGVLLLVVKDDRKVRIEVGYGLEGALPDALSSSIIRNVIVPEFRNNNYYAGISEGVNAIIKTIAGEYKEVKKDSNKKPFGGSFVILLFVLFFIMSMIRRKGRGGRGGFTYYGGGFGGRGGSGFGGGGFGGGGGSFGGGGASGGW